MVLKHLRQVAACRAFTNSPNLNFAIEALLHGEQLQSYGN